MNNIFPNSQPIAILLGVFNAEEYLAEQLESIIGQTYNKWTLYIRDDASTDGTINIIRHYCNKYSNIIFIQDEDGNLGCNGNYFRLLSLVNSNYYMFCNADDYWYKDKIQLSINRILKEEKQHPDTPIIVHTDLSIGDRILKVTAHSYWEAVNTDPEIFKTYNLIGVCNVVAGATMLFNDLAKKAVYPIPSETPFFDHWFALKIVQNGVISSIHTPTMIYRQIGTNLAAVSIGEKNTIFYKIKNVKNIIRVNIKESQMLKKIGWGNIFKYVYFKIIVLYKIRGGHKYKYFK